MAMNPPEDIRTGVVDVALNVYPAFSKYTKTLSAVTSDLTFTVNVPSSSLNIASEYAPVSPTLYLTVTPLSGSLAASVTPVVDVSSCESITKSNVLLAMTVNSYRLGVNVALVLVGVIFNSVFDAA